MKIFLALLISIPIFANTFEEWVEKFRQDALKSGIKQEVINKALSDVKFIKNTIKLDRNQPYKKYTYREYRTKVISPKRVNQGKEKLTYNKSLLNKIAKKYRVNKEVIISLWGIETYYGKITGGYNMIDALASLTYDGRRHKFFKKELLNALKIMQAQNFEKNKFKGSWAGAMGQCQFMPSSYLSYAVDFNNDKKADIWDTKEDVFASIANYLSKNGYKYDQPIAVRVKLSKPIDEKLFSKKVVKSVKDWKELGVELVTWANNDLNAYLSYADDTKTDIFLHFHNYNVISRWNRSKYFIYSVANLSRKIQ